MAESLFSQSWYRVASLTPRLRSHVQIHRHVYRGKDWYVIQDRFTGRFHRLSAEAYQVVGLMDGRSSLGKIWETACERLGDDMPTQDEVIALVSQLFRSDLVESSAMPDYSELSTRKGSGSRNRLWMNLRSPMSVRVPLIDPDGFLAATLWLVRPLTGRFALFGWLTVVLLGIVLATVHWTDLTGNVTDSLLAAENILLITLIYPVVKVFHEFGHAYMVKRWGGEVHEMGVMFLVFIPIPYVDGSSSLSFPGKWQRMTVAAAGIMVELFLAAVALFVWLNVEQGVVSSLAFNVMLVAGISTLLFNGNPLLRFDAYYVLADLLEIPNLGQRANSYVGYLCNRYLLGRGGDSPAESGSEAAWLSGYAVASFCYRMFIAVRILLLVASKFFFIGVLLAAWAGYTMLVLPALRVVTSIKNSLAMSRNRTRILTLAATPLLLSCLVLGGVPLPYHTVAEGVTWAPAESRLYQESDGLVVDQPVRSGERVQAGMVLFKSENEVIDGDIARARARREEFLARYQMSLTTDRTASKLLQEELDRVEAELARAMERKEALLVRSSIDGTFVLPGGIELEGRYLLRGTPLGYVIDKESVIIRVVVGQDVVERVRSDTREVTVRLSQNVREEIPATIIREVPAATRSLPSRALSLEGGGRYAVDPRSDGWLEAIEPLFQFDVAIADGATGLLDQRVWVRFTHTPVPLAWRWYREMRRLLLSRFAV